MEHWKKSQRLNPITKMETIMRMQCLLVLCLLASLLAGCNLPTVTPIPSATVTSLQPSPTATATQPPALSLDTFKNFTFFAPTYKKDVTLVNGKYQAGSGADYFLASLQEKAAFGDLNGDGQSDAALLLAENGGGSGVFVSLIVFLNQNGKPVQAGDMLIDDRPKVDSLAIQDGQITLEGVIHGPNDPMVSPTLAVKETYHVQEKTLVLSRLATKPEKGDWRSIQIESPANGSAASGSVQIKGSMPIAPFENNLSIKLYDAQGNQLFEGPFAVKSQDVGGPATFDNTLDLGPAAGQATVRLELTDVSAANGAPIAIDSVTLVLK
jgi:hypothetical protein